MTRIHYIALWSPYNFIDLRLPFPRGEFISGLYELYVTAVTPAPAPATLALFGLGAGALAVARRRRAAAG